LILETQLAHYTATTAKLGGYNSGSFDDEDEFNVIYE
jgi:hypothetical protein